MNLLQYKYNLSNEVDISQLNEELGDIPPIIPIECKTKSRLRSQCKWKFDQPKKSPIFNWLAKFPKQQKIDLEAVTKLCRNNKIHFEYNPQKYLNLDIYTKNPSSKVMIFEQSIIIPNTELANKEAILKIYKTIYKHFISNNLKQKKVVNNLNDFLNSETYKRYLSR